MAIDYTALFTDLGLIIKKLNTYQTMAGTTFPADKTALATELDNFLECTKRLAPLYDSGQRALVSLRQGLAGINTTRLQDQASVLSNLSLISSDINGVLRALYRQMGLDTQTIDQSTVSLGSPSYAAANVGTGKVFVSKVLDGVTSPGSGLQSCISFNGVNSELAVPSETMVLECIADSEMDRRTEGQESWSLQGGPNYPRLSWETEGSGRGPGVTTFDQASLITNAAFENWNGTTPTGWTISSGGAGVTKESTTFFRGTYGLKFAGDGSLVLGMTQAVNPSRLTARKRYHFSIAVRASAVPAAGNLVIKFTGTGYSAASSEKIDIAAASLPTSWTIHNFWVNLPAVLPSDWALSISVTGPLSNTKNLFLDSITFAPAVYHGGICLAVVAGSANWLRGDRVTWTVANDQAGVFQDFFRRWFGFQLPSDGVGGETIADSLAS